jgi:hypothetical protein
MLSCQIKITLDGFTVYCKICHSITAFNNNVNCKVKRREEKRREEKRRDEKRREETRREEKRREEKRREEKRVTEKDGA